mmetsp:Transcript_113968/g.221337  ORF Transcript_113968/g.221337 Transcript_113968/m.221337 type:complete len:284 (-) Transcript_113968:1434-2285(-)
MFASVGWFYFNWWQRCFFSLSYADTFCALTIEPGLVIALGAIFPGLSLGRVFYRATPFADAPPVLSVAPVAVGTLAVSVSIRLFRLEVVNLFISTRGSLQASLLFLFTLTCKAGCSELQTVVALTRIRAAFQSIVRAFVVHAVVTLLALTVAPTVGELIFHTALIIAGAVSEAGPLLYLLGCCGGGGGWLAAAVGAAREVVPFAIITIRALAQFPVALVANCVGHTMAVTVRVNLGRTCGASGSVALRFALFLVVHCFTNVEGEVAVVVSVFQRQRWVLLSEF